MSTINSFYRDPNAVAYASQLFTSARPAAVTAKSLSHSGTAFEDGSVQSSSQRALARIIEILSLGGDDSVTEAKVTDSLGYITQASGSEGDDNLTLTGRAIYQVETGAGDDTVMAKTSAMSGVALGDGKDTLKASAALLTDIDGGAGDDDLQLTGALIMNVAGGDGNDSIKLSGQTLTGIDGGAGDDTMYLEGNRIFASGGKGNDTVTIHQTGKDNGIAEYAFAAGDGEDTITTDGPLALKLAGYLQGDVTISSKGNTMTVSFAGSTDKLTITLEGMDAKGGAPTYAFSNDNGRLTLTIKPA